jgi:membrane protein implicated in regulation of membrane protease activity
MTVFLIKTSVFSLFFHVKWSYDPVSQVFPVESGIFSSKKYPFFIICQLTNGALSVILYTEPNHGKQKGGNNMNWAYTILWVVLMVVFLVVEAACPFHLVSIWFAIGSLVAVVVNLLGGALWLQITLFLVVSVALLAALWPLVKKFINPKVTATNVDSVIGTEGYVTTAVDNLAAEGKVKLGGMEWTARSTAGAAIPAGTLVKVDRIEGVKVFVSEVKVKTNA